jgi:hypothetical protein
MPEHIDFMPILPIEQMLRDADRGMQVAGLYHGPDTLTGDLACHVLALVAELEKAAEACALAHSHLDTYGVVGVEDDDREKVSQERVFEAVGPFTRAVGHKFVSVYFPATPAPKPEPRP